MVKKTNPSIDTLVSLLRGSGGEVTSFSGSLGFGDEGFREIWLSNTEEFGFYHPAIESAEQELGLNQWDARAFLLSIFDNRFNLHRGYLVYDDWRALQKEPGIVMFPDFDFESNELARLYYEFAHTRTETKCTRPSTRCWYEVRFEFLRNPESIKSAADIIESQFSENYRVESVYLELK